MPKLTVVKTVKVSVQTAKALKQQAYSEERKESEIIRRALVAYLAKPKPSENDTPKP